MTKVEIYLPFTYNDGSLIEIEKFEEVQHELISMFGAFTASSLLAPYKGVWKYGGVEYRDDIVIFHVVTPGDQQTDEFFKSYKETLKERFRQLDVLITKQIIQTY